MKIKENVKILCIQSKMPDLKSVHLFPAIFQVDPSTHWFALFSHIFSISVYIYIYMHWKAQLRKIHCNSEKKLILNI